MKANVCDLCGYEDDTLRKWNGLFLCDYCYEYSSQHDTESGKLSSKKTETKWVNSTITDTTCKYVKMDCRHTGNKKVIEYGSAAVYAGGWTRGAKPKKDWIVVDLDGYYYETITTIPDYPREFSNSMNVMYRDAPKVLYLHIRDYGVPAWDATFWVTFANDILSILKSGKNVLVACMGGHGRTGMVVAILLGILTNVDDPIGWVREKYCYEAIETKAQEKYVRDILGISR